MLDLQRLRMQVGQHGEVPEWTKGHAWRASSFHPSFAHLAQSVCASVCNSFGDRAPGRYIFGRTGISRACAVWS